MERPRSLPRNAQPLAALVAGLSLGAGQSAPALADVVLAAPDQYVLRHEAVSAHAPDALWARLVAPQNWWSSDHTYSGDAANLSLDPQAGGVWREDWAGGSVAHGHVLTATPPQTLRLNAPFGPLQGMGVTVIWTITISPEGTGARVVFDEVATGAAASGLDAMAPAVDAVKGEAMARLTQTGAFAPADDAPTTPADTGASD